MIKSLWALQRTAWSVALRASALPVTTLLRRTDRDQANRQELFAYLGFGDDSRHRRLGGQRAISGSGVLTAGVTPSLAADAASRSAVGSP